MYKLQDKDTTGRGRWNIATQERNIFDMEIEIGSFVINGSVKITAPPDRQE